MLTDLKAEVERNAIIEGDLSTTFSTMIGSSKQKIIKEMLDLNYRVDQINLTDIYRTFH